MRRLKKDTLFDLALFFLFVLAFSFIHGHQLFFVPAINYDEVRAGQYAHDFAFQKNAWLFHGMNAYTVPLSSYWAALFFKVFGSGLLSLRLSGLFSVFFGVLLCSLALAHSGRKAAARSFPFLLTFWPALFMNHRYSMEANTLHLFCLGLFLWGLVQLHDSATPSKWGRFCLASGSILGILAHPFFLAPSLAALILRLLSPREISQKERTFLSLLLIFFGAYFVQVLLFIPEKEKPIALLLLDFLLLLCVRHHGQFLKFYSDLWAYRWIRRSIYGVGGILSGIALVFLFVYLSTPWSVLTATGRVMHTELIFLELGFWLFLILVGVQKGVFKHNLNTLLPPQFLPFFVLTTLICALILIQPSARCYEISLVLFVGAVSILFGALSRKTQWVFLLLWCVLGTLQWKENYLKPVLTEQTQVKPLQFLFVKGITETYPSSQRMLERLSTHDCKLDGIDPRYVALWKDAMEFLKRAPELPFPHSDCKL